MKRLIAVCLLLTLAFSCAGCGGAPTQTASEPSAAESTIPPTPIPQKAESVPVEDCFVLIQAGSFL